jgi:hypothetical protein
MKKIVFCSFLLFLSSCSVQVYYQIFKTDSENSLITKDKILFEDNHCAISYNLWSKGGDPGFSIYNKTTNDLTIHLNKSFFILNGVAFEYFKNRTFSKSTNNGTTVISYSYPFYWPYNVTKVAGTNSASFSTSYIEKPELTIPPKTLITITEYTITDKRFNSCDLPKFPTKKRIKTLKFDKTNSPFVFYNRITYSTKNDTLIFENKFHVNEITNYPSSVIFSSIDTSSCGKKLDIPKRVFKNESPDKFYIKYSAER